MTTNNTISFTKNEKRRSVTVVLERRDSWGSVRKRSQFTISERQFNAALLDAQIVTPWRVEAS